MLVWLVRDLEPIPTDPENRRLMRMGMLAQALAQRGIAARWFTSSFDHYQKRQREPRRQTVWPEDNLEISILPGPGYRRNVSIGRISHNRAFAQAFIVETAKSGTLPDVIVTDIPTTEAAAAAVAFGKARGIPTIVSIRDLWPDFFAAHFPPAVRPLARMLVKPLELQARNACLGASSLVGISEQYLQWGLDKAGRERSTRDVILPLGYAPVPIGADQAGEICAQLGIGASARLVSFVGSWGHTYDIRLLEETARILLGRGDVKILIAGSGEQSARMRPRLKGLDNVILPGWVDAKEIAAILMRTEIGLLPYMANAPQGLSNKVFEYMAYGAYQVASIGGELSQFYAQTGAGSAEPVRTAAEMAEAITRALDDSTVASGRAARMSDFAENWHAARIYERFVDHILAIAAREI